MYSCDTCGDTYCDGCQTEIDGIDPVLASLSEYQPIAEPMTLEEWEEREATPWAIAEDARARAAADLAWSRHARERRAA